MPGQAEGAPFSYPDALLHDLFRQQAARTPQRVAVVDAPPGQAARQLTYAELDKLTNELALYLRSAGVCEDRCAAGCCWCCSWWCYSRCSPLAAARAARAARVARAARGGGGGSQPARRQGAAAGVRV